MSPRRTETARVNGFSITLPVGVNETMNTKVKDSYQSFTRDGLYHVMRHIYAYTTMMPPLLREQQPKRILHPFGGLGGMAQLIEQVLEYEPEQTFWERDPDCVAWLREHWHHVVHVQNSIKWLMDPVEYDLSAYDWIIFDLSVCTIKTPGVKECWDRFGELFRKGTLKAVWLTDTACHKIHLNGRTYAKDFGVDTPTSEAYLRAYDEFLRQRGMCIHQAMREAGSYYAMITAAKPERFGEITYMGPLASLNIGT